jgi:hypothetical protein
VDSANDPPPRRVPRRTLTGRGAQYVCGRRQVSLEVCARFHPVSS